MKRFFLLSLTSLWVAAFLFCEKIVTVEKIPPKKPCEILSPVSGQVYSPDNPVWVIAQYDRTQFSRLDWEYSLDYGGHWNVMTFESPNSGHKDTVLDINIDYDVRTWIPNKDNLQDTVIWIKGSAYGGTKYVVKENIRIRTIH